MCSHRNLVGSKIVNSRKITISLRWQTEIKDKEEDWP